jgi:hypothetical protein
MSEVEIFFKNFWQTQLRFNDSKELDALPWSSFIRLVSIQNIKSCGTKIEKRIISANGWEKVKGQKNHGDAKTAAGQIVEIKSSIVSPLPTSGVTFRGIRLWSAMDFYCFVLTNFQTPSWEPVTTVFKLTSEDLKAELAFGILKPYNMKKNDRAHNEKTELGISFSISNNDPTYQRWLKKYQTSEIRLDYLGSEIKTKQAS